MVKKLGLLLNFAFKVEGIEGNLDISGKKFVFLLCVEPASNPRKALLFLHY